MLLIDTKMQFGVSQVHFLDQYLLEDSFDMPLLTHRCHTCQLHVIGPIYA
uniref:Uncharacterized protein n=1 Tax=Medicago truncatula TaxID=3880 RepID=I3S6X1_MEDTR|nr:unknown [Medicago truncatula]